jgi:glycine oxidase
MIIVGGGIIGLACAWRLAQRGVAVTIIEARELASEASWAGAGMLAPGGEVDDPSPLARMALSSIEQYPDFVQTLEDASGLSIDYRRCGAMELAFNDAEAEALERRACRQMEAGIRSEYSVHPGSAAARFYPDDALVNPRDITTALHIACLRAGVSIREHEPVVEVFPDGSGVRTALGEYRDNGVLVAAGAWSSRLCSNLRVDLPETIPVRGHLIAWESPGNLLGPILRHGHTYVLQRRAGVVVAGSSTEHVGFDRAIDETAVADIHARAAELLPALALMQPTERWNGFRPGIEGGFPAIGRIEGSCIWTAFGHYRNGILLAPETARTIEESVLSAGL